MRYYISDLHFFHEALNTQMDRRGFGSAAEMNEFLVRQWNRRVRQGDEVVVLGDLSLGKGEETSGILDRLNGKIYLIEGNHDRFLRDQDFRRERLEWVKPYAEMHDNRRKVVLCHYPVFCYNGQYQRDGDGNPRTYMLYGHVHRTHDQRLVEQFQRITRNTPVYSRGQEALQPAPCQMINCFCMDSEYLPLTLDEWIEVERKRSWGETEEKK